MKIDVIWNAIVTEIPSILIENLGFEYYCFSYLEFEILGISSETHLAFRKLGILILKPLPKR